MASSNAVAHHNLAVALYAKGEHAAATGKYREAVRFDPDFAEGHYGLGLALASQGNI